MQTGLLKQIALWIIGCGSILLAAEPTETSEFEGVLTYELNAGGRVWTVQHAIRGADQRTDVLLNELKFQSFLTTGGESYIVDVLGKRIMPLFRGPRAMPRDNSDASVEDDTRSGALVTDPDALSDELPPPPPSPPEGETLMMGPGRPDRMEAVEPETPVGEGEAFDGRTLKFEFKVEKRAVIIEGLSGFGTLPRQVFAQFEDLRDAGPKVISTCEHYQLVPVRLEVEKRKKADGVVMTLLSIESMPLPDSLFELPSDYALQMPGPGGPGGGSGRGDAPKSGRGGPPPGGGRGGPPMGGGGM